MSVYYSGRLVTRFFSKLDASRDFPTADEARAWDWLEAALTIGDAEKTGVFANFALAEPRLVEALRFLADEIESALPVGSAP